MSMWVWLLGVATGIIIMKLISAYINIAIEAEKKAILIELVKFRRDLVERKKQIEEEIQEMKR